MQMTITTLGERLKSARKASGLNQTEAAKRAGLSQSLLSELEGGLYTSSGFTIQLANIYRVSPMWLAHGAGLRDLSSSDEASMIGRKFLEADETTQRMVLLALGGPESSPWASKAALAALDAVRQIVIEQSASKK